MVLAGATACSQDSKSPTEVRRERVETRLRQTYPDSVVTCMLGRLDAADLRALDRRRTLEPGSRELQRWSRAVTACTAAG